MTDTVALYRAVSAAREAWRRGIELQTAARCAATLCAVDPHEVSRRARWAEQRCEAARETLEQNERLSALRK